MGNALSIAAVSRILRQIVENSVTAYGLDGYVGEDVVVTAEPPDENDDQTRINLFMFRASESAAMRNNALPSYDHLGRPVARPTLALDLHYSVTAYASGDFNSEILLGTAMQALLETPTLDRSLILNVLSQDNGANTLLDSRLAEQIENIRIRHRNVPEDTLTRVWSGFQVPYRPSVFYEVSVALIQSDIDLRAAVPVLARPEPQAHGNLGPVTPTLLSADPGSAVVGQAVTLEGLELAGDTIRLEPISRSSSQDTPALDIPAADATETSIAFAPPANWPVGVYDLRATMEPLGGGARRPSNVIAFTVAPSITVDNIARDAAPPNLVTIELSVTPEIQPSQTVSLIVGSQVIRGPAITAATGNLTFADLDLAAGQTTIRLRVDSIDSPWIDRDATPAAILPAAIVNIP